MARFRLGRTVGYRRLAALVDCGLLARARLVYGQPALYTATRDGVAWAGIPQLEAGADRRRDDTAFGHLRAARRPARAPRASGGVGRAQVARRRTRGRPGRRERPARPVTRR